VDRLHEKAKFKYLPLGEEIGFDGGWKMFEEWAEENDLFQEKKKEANEVFNWGSIKNLNESIFDDVVYELNKDVVVIFWNKDTKNLKEIKNKYMDYANRFKLNEHLVFAEMNLDKGEIQGINMDGNSEKVIIFPHKAKTKNSELLSDLKNEKKFIAFIKKYTSFDWVEPAEYEKPKDEL